MGDYLVRLGKDCETVEALVAGTILSSATTGGPSTHLTAGRQRRPTTKYTFSGRRPDEPEQGKYHRRGPSRNGAVWTRIHQ